MPGRADYCVFWFRRAHDKEDTVSASQGLALTLIERKDFLTAEDTMYRWRDASKEAKADMQLAKKEGLNVVKVVTQEDISNAPREDADNRRGLMGCLPVYKVAGAAAEAGLPLKDVAGIAQRMADNMATIAVAAAPGPAAIQYRPPDGHRCIAE